jgi:plastocyanin
MRRTAQTLAAATALTLIAAPAQAADQTVRATQNNTFTPNTVTISPGDTVTWVNDGGIHNVKFDDGSFEEPSSPSFTWSSNPRRTFEAAGEYRYFCEQHGSTGGVGMAGRVIVEGGTQPPPPGGEPPDTTPPDIDNLRFVPARFCNKKTRTCRKVGTVIRFDLDERARLSGRIVNRRTGKKAGSISLSANAGANEFDYSGSGLRLGRYRLELFAKDSAGNRTPKPTRANFTVASRR